MNFWNQHDLEVMETRDKMILLKEEFDKKHRIDIKDYSKKLNRFLDRKLKKESNQTLKRHIFMMVFSLSIMNRKV